MKICVIGGTGHIGQNLTRLLVETGHEVSVVASGRTATPALGVWQSVRKLQAAYGSSGWTETVANLNAEVVIDIWQGDSPALYEAVRETCEHLIVCGSVWMFGLPRVVPTPEETQSPCPFEGYARRLEIV